MIDILAVRGLEGVDGARQPPRVSEDDLHFSRGHILAASTVIGRHKLKVVSAARVMYQRR